MKDERIGAGITESVLTGMTDAPGIRVIDPVMMALAATGIKEDPGCLRLACLELGTTLLLRGTFERAGQRLRVTARLVDAESGTVVETFETDGQLDELFDVQDRITAQLNAFVVDQSDTQAPVSYVR